MATVLRSEFISHMPPMGKAIAGERSEARLLYPQSPPHHRKIKIIKETHRKHKYHVLGKNVDPQGTYLGRMEESRVARQGWKNLKGYNQLENTQSEDLISRNQPNATRKRKHESSKTKPEGNA